MTVAAGLTLSFKKFERAVMKTVGVKSPCDLTPGVQYYVIMGCAPCSFEGPVVASHDHEFLTRVAWNWNFDELLAMMRTVDGDWQFFPDFDYPALDKWTNEEIRQRIFSTWPEFFSRLVVDEKPKSSKWSPVSQPHVHPLFNGRRPSMAIIKAVCKSISFPRMYQVEKLRATAEDDSSVVLIDYSQEDWAPNQFTYLGY